MSQEDINIIKEIRTMPRNEKSVKMAFEVYNRNNERKERKMWCGGCVERVFKWINHVNLQ